MSQFKPEGNPDGIKLPLHAQNPTGTPQRKKLAVDRTATQAALDEMHQLKQELRAELKVVNRQIYDLTLSLKRHPK